MSYGYSYAPQHHPASHYHDVPPVVSVRATNDYYPTPQQLHSEHQIRMKSVRSHQVQQVQQHDGPQNGYARGHQRLEYGHNQYHDQYQQVQGPGAVRNNSLSNTNYNNNHHSANGGGRGGVSSGGGYSSLGPSDSHSRPALRKAHSHAGLYAHANAPHSYNNERSASYGSYTHQPYPPHNKMNGQDLQKPYMGATFYPGGDDFYMPDVVSPLPQRVMPEMSSNIQEGLQHLELEANSVNRPRSTSAVSRDPYTTTKMPITKPQPTVSTSPALPPKDYSVHAWEKQTNASSYQNLVSPYPASSLDTVESPTFSPFPKIINPGKNIPLSDDEKEGSLDRARPLVLQSTDPEMQLAWAQDSLTWVEVAMQVQTRQDGTLNRSVTPKVEHQLRVDALNIVNFLADQGHPRAEFLKAMWLEFGKFGYRVDKKEAFLGYRRAAEKGYARAEYRIGMQYESSNDMHKALKHYNKGVALGDSAANYRLGMMTLLGQHNQAQNWQLGIERIRIAADTADENAPQGAYIYGMLLARELSTITVPEQYLPMDLNKAKIYIEKAAFLGFAKAQMKMASAYELCQFGCDFSPALSLHYAALASRQGEPDADMLISKWFLCGYEGVFDKNEELAFTYAQRAAQQGLTTAEFALGYFYEIGVFVPNDIVVARNWYTKAADHGNKDAVGRLESIAQQKTLSKTDHEQIAISRIKSTYGSRRGGRPERFKERTSVPTLPTIPSISDERIVTPPSSARRVSPGAGHQRGPSGGVNYPQQRPLSAAPYPVDDGPPPVNSFSQPSLSPYYNPNVRPSSRGSGGPGPAPISDRPQSSFGIKPLPHSNTEPNNSSSNPTLPIRPSSSTGNMQQYPPRREPQQLPPRNDSMMSAGWQPQVPPSYNRQPSPSREPQLPPLNFNDRPLSTQRPQPPPKLNAPAQNLPPVPNPYSNARPTPPAAAYNSPVPSEGSNRITKRPVRAPSPNPAPGPRVPSVTPSMQSTSSASSAPPSIASTMGRPASTTSSISTAGGPQKTTASAKMGTGPKTFDEMGIAHGKQDSECIVM